VALVKSAGTGWNCNPAVAALASFRRLYRKPLGGEDYGAS